jgi:ubiquitin-protein ligase
MKKHPIIGFTVDFADETDLYEWDVYIEGPEDTD